MGDCNRLSYLRREGSLGRTIEKLAGLIGEVQRLSSDPDRDFSRMVGEEHWILLEDVVCPAVARGVNLLEKIDLREPKCIVSEDLINKVYCIIRCHLTGIGTWDKTIKKFPPATLKRMIRNAWYYLPVSYDSIDWGTEFEDLHDYDKVDDFLDALIARGNLKRGSRELEYNQILYNLKAQARALGLVLVDCKEAEELQKLKGQRYQTCLHCKAKETQETML